MKLPRKSYMSRMKSEEGKRLFELYFGKGEINPSQNNSPKEIINPVVKDCVATQPKESTPAPTESFDTIRSITKNDMSLTDILNYYKQEGVVGEENNLILQTLCAINNISFGIEGYSGSGKTFLTDALLNLIPDEYVYRIGLSSNLAILNDSKNINGKKFVYIPEIQKAMNKKDAPIVEVIKNLTEGKDANRIVTLSQGKTKQYNIKAGITVIYTLAVENNFKKDDETSRRFLRLFTDYTEEHIGEILDYKAKSRCFFNDKSRMSEEDIEELKVHITNCININEVSYVDSFAPLMNTYIPSTPKTVGYVDHYYNLLNASAKFHHRQRIQEGKQIFLNLEDHFLIHELYHSEFCDSISNLNKAKDYSDLIENARKEVDWQKCWESGNEIMKTNFSSVYDKWRDLQIQGNSIELKNPITNYSVTVNDQNEHSRNFTIIR